MEERSSKNIHIYIEGDGLAGITWFQPSDNLPPPPLPLWGSTSGRIPIFPDMQPTLKSVNLPLGY